MSRRPASPSLWATGLASVASKSSCLHQASRVWALVGLVRPLMGWHSFANLEMTSCLSKMLFKYDLELVSKDLDWEAASKCYVMWLKVPIYVTFEEVKH